MSWRSFTPSLSTPGGTDPLGSLGSSSSEHGRTPELEVGLERLEVELAAKMKLVLELVGAEGICFGVWGLGFRV